MNPDPLVPLRIFKASGRPATVDLLKVAVRVVRDQRLSWTAVGLLSYLLTQRSRVVDYQLSAFAERGRITFEQLSDALVLLVECGYLVAYQDGWRLRAVGDRRQRFPYG